MHTKIWDLVEILSQCRSEDQFRKSIEAHFATFGISGVTWVVGAFSPQSRDYFTTANRELLEDWLSQTDASPRISAMWARMQRRELSPRLWGAALDDGEARSPEFRKHCELMSQCGYTSNISIPIWRKSPSEHEVVTYSTSMNATEFNDFIRWTIPLITASASLLSVQMATFRARVADIPALTTRETECLLWLASGLRHDRLADRLGISEWTVGFHLRNARAKLCADTNEQAVAKAVIWGLISP